MYLYKTLRIIANVVFRLFFKIEVIGKGNIPKKGRLLLCSNHIHNLDPIILSIIVPREIAWMGKEELFKNKVTDNLFRKLGVFPVDRQETSMSTIRHSMRILNKEGILGIFPEGTRVKEINLENAKPGVALISIKSKSPILPIYIEGSYKPFSTIKIFIGDMFDFSEKYNQKLGTSDYKLYGQEILKTIYSIKLKQEEF